MSRQCYYRAGFVMFLTIVAFFALTPKPGLEAGSGAMSLNKFIELGLLTLSSIIVTGLVLLGGCRMRLRSGGFFIVACYTLWAMVSSLWSPDMMLSLAKALELGMLCFISMGLVFYIRHNSTDTAEALANTLCWAMIASVIFLFMANFVIFGTPFHFSGPGWGRPPRLKIAYAHALDLVDLAALTGLAACATKMRVSVALGICGLMFLIIHYADGRSGLAFFLITMAVVWCRRVRSPTWSFLIALSGIAGFALVTLIAVLGPKHLLPDNLSTLQGRLPLWEYSITVIQDNALLGVGYYSARYFLTDFAAWAGHAHNSYVEVLLTTGTVGAMLMIIFLLHAFKTAFSKGQILLSAMIVYIALESMFNPILFFPLMPSFLAFLTYFGAIEGTRKPPRPHFYPGAPPPVWMPPARPMRG